MRYVFSVVLVVAAVLTFSSIGTMRGPGNVTAVEDGIGRLSDQRIKDKVEEIEDPLEKILSLRGVQFVWGDKSRTPNKKGIGMIAQEVQEVFPMIVSTDSEGFRKVDYEVLVAPLIGAVKEINDRDVDEIKALKKQNADLIEEYRVMKAWICAKDPEAEFCPKPDPEEQQ